MTELAAGAARESVSISQDSDAQPEVPIGVLVANLLKKLDDNPGMRAAAFLLLSECAGGRQEETALLERAETALRESNAMPIQPLSAVVDMLVREGALVEKLEVNGEAYAGTLEEAFVDTTIPDDAEALIYGNTG